MKNLRILYILAAALITASSCTTLYKPNAVHSPMLSQKGDGHVTASLGVMGSGLGNLQGAVAVTDHIGIMVDGMYHYRSLSQTDYYDTSRTETLNIYSFGGGLGYFEKIGYRERTVLQIYAGGGYGVSKARMDHFQHPKPFVDAEFFEGYIQPGLVFLNRYIDMSVDVRIKYVQMNNIVSYRYNEFDWYHDDHNQNVLGRKIDFLLCDPSFSMKAGGKHLKGLIQAGFHVPVMNAEGYLSISRGMFLDPIFFFNIGMSYTFGKVVE